MFGIFEEPSVSDALDAACERWARAMDAWEAIKWSVAHDPEDETTSLSDDGHTRLLVSEGAASIGWPTIAIVFEYNRYNITILEAQFSNAKAPQPGRA